MQNFVFWLSIDWTKVAPHLHSSNMCQNIYRRHPWWTVCFDRAERHSILPSFHRKCWRDIPSDPLWNCSYGHSTILCRSPQIWLCQSQIDSDKLAPVPAIVCGILSPWNHWGRTSCKTHLPFWSEPAETNFKFEFSTFRYRFWLKFSWMELTSVEICSKQTHPSNLLTYFERAISSHSIHSTKRSKIASSLTECSSDATISLNIAKSNLIKFNRSDEIFSNSMRIIFNAFWRNSPQMSFSTANVNHSMQLRIDSLSQKILSHASSNISISQSKAIFAYSMTLFPFISILPV